MIMTKRILLSRVIGGILGGIIVLTPFGASANEITNSNSNNKSSIISVSEREKESEHLYKTENGRCYHKNGCSYLKYSQIKVTDEKIKENELKPCSRCLESKNNKVNQSEVEEDKKQSNKLYRTKTGKCFHKGNCKCLKKSKIKVSREEIKEADLKPCFKCCK